MKTFIAQLLEIKTNAELVIKTAIDKHNGNIDIYDVTQPLTESEFSKMPMLTTEDRDGENIDIWVYGITKYQILTKIKAIDERGKLHVIYIEYLDTHNACVLADFLNQL